MGSLISVGENITNSDCCCKNLTSFTLSEDAFNKMKQPAEENASESFIVPEAFAAEIAEGVQADEYLKIMRCVQNQHSKKFGLSAYEIDELCNSLSTFTRPLNHVGLEEEQKLLNCFKEKTDVIECNDPYTEYTEAIDKHAQHVADVNSRSIKVDSSVFLK